jgi:guanylate kinase
VSTQEFERMRDAGDLLEWFEVYGDLKGTPRAPIEEHLAAGSDVLVEVDVNGALEVRRAFPAALLVFLRPPSREVQRARLLARDPTADPKALETRLAEAEAEEARAASFDAVVVNDEVDRAVEEISALLAGRRRAQA